MTATGDAIIRLNELIDALHPCNVGNIGDVAEQAYHALGRVPFQVSDESEMGYWIQAFISPILYGRPSNGQIDMCMPAQAIVNSCVPGGLLGARQMAIGGFDGGLPQLLRLLKEATIKQRIHQFIGITVNKTIKKIFNGEVGLYEFVQAFLERFSAYVDPEFSGKGTALAVQTEEKLVRFFEKAHIAPTFARSLGLWE
jgi:hypothetical protein